MAYQGLQLVLYKGTAPNKDNGLHIIAKKILAYAQSLTPNIYKTINADKFTYNDNLIILAANEVTEKDLDEVTYAVVYTRKDGETLDDTYANMRCLFVTSSFFQSGKAYLKCKVDLWGTHICNGFIHDLHINRCNRNIANGIYDTIKNGKGHTELIRLNPKTMQLADVSCVFALEFNEVQNEAFGRVITKTGLFYFTLQDLYDHVHTSHPEHDTDEIIEKTIDMVGGVYALVAGAWGQETKAQVLKMWLVPTAAITAGTYAYFPKTACRVTGANGGTLPWCVLVKPSHYVEQIDMKAKLDYPATDWKFYLPQYHIEFGTPYRGMPISRFTQETNITIHYVFDNADVRVYVEDGLRQHDISEGFEISMTTNNSSQTSLEILSKTMSNFTSLVAASTKGFAAGGVGGAIAGAGLTGLGILKANSPTKPINSITTGDGALTFSKGSANEVNYPYCLMVTESNGDELDHAMIYGAEFDLNIYDIYGFNLTSYAYLGRGANVPYGGTFIAVDDFFIDNVPSDAEAYIRAELARGVWLKVLS